MEYSPIEFTPELNADYLNAIKGSIAEDTAADEGRAVKEANDRGLGGQAFEGSLVGMARASGRQRTSAAVNDFNYRLAGMKRDERLRGEGRAWQKEDQSWESAEREKDRAWKKMMAEYGYQEQKAQFQREDLAAKQGAVIGGLFEGASRGGAASILAFSDERLKQDIVLVGATPGGHKVYEYAYRVKDFPTLNLPEGRHTGVMAQEAQKIAPHAVMMKDGFLAVDYRRIL